MSLKPARPEPVRKTLLDRARAWLCWDRFPDLTIQLIPLHSEVSFYYPPWDRSTILLYYRQDETDFSRALFLLFHEAGHHEQFSRTGSPDIFCEQMQRPRGDERLAFEKESWDLGQELLSLFLADQEPERTRCSLLSRYSAWAEQCLQSYDTP